MRPIAYGDKVRRTDGRWESGKVVWVSTDGKLVDVNWPDYGNKPEYTSNLERITPPHQHEDWQLLDSAQGGKYCGACGQQVTTQETTKENTMTEFKKTFESLTTEGRVLEVIDTDGMLRLKINSGPSHITINLSKDDVPAIGLALFTGSGIVPQFHGVPIRGTNKHLEFIASSLTEYVEANDAEAQAAKEREELLAKQLDKGRRLYNASRSACDLVWEDLTYASKNVWVKRMEDAAKILDRINEVKNS